METERTTLNEIFKNSWPYINELFLKRNYPVYFESYKLLSDFSELDNKSNFNNKIAFFKEIVGIEMLIRDDNNFRIQIKDDFSIRASRLLGKSFLQRSRLQNYLGTLYDVRSSIVHQFKSENIRNVNYKKYFDNNFLKSLIILRKLHSLILLRMIISDNKLMSKKQVVEELGKNLIMEVDIKSSDRAKTRYIIKKRIEQSKALSLPESKYMKLIEDHIEQITGFKSDKKFDEEIAKKLFNNNYFVLAISSYGGVTESVNGILDCTDLFYHNYIIETPSDDETLKKLKTRIDEKLRQILLLPVNEIILFLKSHLSILVYFGYYFNKQNKMGKYNKTLTSFFTNQKKKDIEEFYFELNYKAKEDICSLPDIKNQPTEAILSIRISKDYNINGSIKELSIQNLPVLEYIYNESELLEGKYIEHSGKVKEYLTWIKNDLKNRSHLKKIHLITRLPDIMMIFLGIIFSELNLEVSVYEKSEQSEKMIKILDCK